MIQMEQKVDENYKKVIRLKIFIMFLAFGLAMGLTLMAMSGSLILMLHDIMNVGMFLTEFYVGLVLLIIFTVGGIPISTISANVFYDNYTYVLQEDGLFIRSGIITKTQKIIPYKSIQEITVTSGLIERRYELSDIQIRTAGGIVYARGGYLGLGVIIPGIREPEPIIKEIRSKVEEQK